MKEGCGSSGKKDKRSVSLPVIAGQTATGPVRASRTSRWRAAALIALNLLMVIHFLQWWSSGSTISPIEPSETMYTLQNGAVNAGFIFFVLAITATLIFGRFVCGWGCHILALQDLCAWLLKKAGLTPKPFRSRLLVFVPLIAALYMFVLPTVIRYFSKPVSEPLFPAFTNHLITTEFWATFPPLAVAIPFLFICGGLTVYFLGSKGFCTYACPYGGFFSIAEKVSPGRIRVNDDCNQCGHCTATCTSNVIVHAEVKQHGMVVDPGCMKCMDCVSVCPNDALYFGFGRPAAAVGKSISKNYSLTWPEEILAAVLFAASYLAVWDVYQLVPMLMALGIAAVTTFIVVRGIKLVRSDQLAFYRFNLASGGKIRAAGWGFLVFATVWIAIVTHSGWIHYHESVGSAAYAGVNLPDELALAEADPSHWLSQHDNANIEAGRSHLRIAFNYGLFTNIHALPKLAWLEFLAGNGDEAVRILENAAAQQSGQARALSLYYRGAILNRLRRYDVALVSLDRAITERPDLISVREEKGEAQWQLGKKQEAIATWNDAVRQNPRLPVANSMLAGAAASMGRSDLIEKYQRAADQSTPNDPYFHWMLGLRLQNIGMKDLAEKHFARAEQLEPSFRSFRPAAGN